MKHEPSRIREHGTRVTTSKDGDAIIAACRRIVHEGQYAKINGHRRKNRAILACLAKTLCKPICSTLRADEKAAPGIAAPEAYATAPLRAR